MKKTLVLENKKNKVGVMQGRLLPKYKGRYQAHPVGYWDTEFLIASKLKLNCIEFILDFDEFEKNPLTSAKGIKKISDVCAVTGVEVCSICADYFMDAPLHSKDDEVSEKSLKMLRSLLMNSKNLNISDIIIPCVDQASLKSADCKKRLIDKLLEIIPFAEQQSINICLETDLPPDQFHNLIVELNSKIVTVNYDIGNSASLGFNVREEFQAYGHRISDVHIKDRLANGGSVILGHGCANFPLVFELLNDIGYRGPFIMQAFRDNQAIKIFQKQLNWIAKFLRYKD